MVQWQRAGAAGDVGSIPGSGRSPGEGNGSWLQYSCVENPRDSRPWWATVHGVAKNRTWLNDLACMQDWNDVFIGISFQVSKCTYSSSPHFLLVSSLVHAQLFATPWTAAPGSSVLHYLPEFAQSHVYWVGDAIQPSHPLPPPSAITFSLSQHQGLVPWVSRHMSHIHMWESRTVSGVKMPFN